jgi:hypothetical protein
MRHARGATKLRVMFGTEIAIGPGKAELLAAIAETGSISASAKRLGMSYRRAWLLVDTMNRCFREPVVASATGGSGRRRRARDRLRPRRAAALPRDARPRRSRPRSRARPLLPAPEIGVVSGCILRSMDALDLLVAALFFLVAVLYSTVGHAGASGYLAVMGLVGLAPEVMRPTALLLNIAVAAFTTWRFREARFFDPRALGPFVVGSVPCAFIGGTIRLPSAVYQGTVGLVLLVSAAVLVWRAYSPRFQGASARCTSGWRRRSPSGWRSACSRGSPAPVGASS